MILSGGERQSGTLPRIVSELGTFKARLVSTGHLLAGSFSSMFIGLAAFAITARALGPTDYGLLALVFAYVRAMERLLSFQSWQAIVKYGAPLLDNGQVGDYRSLLKFGFLLDAASAVLACLLSIALVLAAAPFLGIGEQMVQYTILCSLVLAIQIRGMPTAVMRLSGRFRMLAYGQLINSLIHLLLCAIGLYLGKGLFYFIIVLAGTHAIGAVTYLLVAFRTLWLQGVRGILSAPLAGVRAKFPDIWGFAFSSNLSLTIRSSSQELDTLIVGALADPTAAGLYHIAKRVGRLAHQVGLQVQAVLYPDLARLWARNKIREFKIAISQVEILLLCFGLGTLGILYFTIDELLRLTAGPLFAMAAPLVLVQMIAVIFRLAGSAVRSGLLAAGAHRQLLRIVLVSTIGFHFTAFLLIPQIGAMGANIAHIVAGVIWSVWIMITLRSILSHGKPSTTAGTEGADNGQPRTGLEDAGL